MLRQNKATDAEQCNPWKTTPCKPGHSCLKCYIRQSWELVTRAQRFISMVKHFDNLLYSTFLVWNSFKLLSNLATNRRKKCGLQEKLSLQTRQKIQVPTFYTLKIQL